MKTLVSMWLTNFISVSAPVQYKDDIVAHRYRHSQKSHIFNNKLFYSFYLLVSTLINSNNCWKRRRICFLEKNNNAGFAYKYSAIWWNLGAQNQGHGLINYLDTKAKWCHKKLACKGTLCQMFIDWRDSQSSWYFRSSFVNYSLPQINSCRKVPL
jgi:hypothetical protein